MAIHAVTIAASLPSNNGAPAMVRNLLAGVFATVLAWPLMAAAQVSDETVQSLSAPDTIEAGTGTLEFKDGVPTAETASHVFDAVNFANALAVYNNSFRGASALAIVKGFQEAGVNFNEVAIFEKLMDANSL